MAEKNTDELLLKKQRLPRPALFVFLFLVGAIAFSGYFYYRNQRKDVFNEQISQLKTIADLKASQIVNWLAERIANDRLITQDPDRVATLSAFFRDRSNAARRESVQYWLSSLQKVYHYENVLLLDRQGEVVLAANPQHAQVGSEGLKAIETARRLRDVVLTNLHDNPQVPHIHLDLVAPLISGEELSGFVILRIDPGDFLFPMIQSWPTPSPSAETLLVRREGDNVLFLNELRHRKDTALKLRLPLRNLELPAAQAILGRSGAFSGRDYRGVDVWSVVRPVEGTLWFIVAKVDRDELEQPMRRSALAVFLVALFLILAAAAIILFLWQRQNSRLRLSQFAALRESGDKFKYVFDNSMVGKSITLPNGEISVNKAFCEMLGYSAEELQSRKWQELTHPDDVESTQRMLDQVISGKMDAVRFEKRYLHKNGAIVWADVSTSLRRDEQGQPLYFMTSVLDITKRKKAENQLKKSESKLRAVLDATPFPIAMVDLLDDTIYYWSRSALALFGHTAPTSAQWYEIAYPDPDYRCDVIERWKSSLENARATGQPVNTGEYRVTCRDGSVRICELYATFLDENLIVTFNDITERTWSEEQVMSQLQELQRWHNVMLGGEDRLQKLKREVNELCRRLGETPRYASQESDPGNPEIANAEVKE